jgi:hypothetical protein
MKRFPAVLLLALGMLGAADAATAQGDSAPQAPRVELWGAVTGVITGAAGRLITSYSPRSSSTATSQVVAARRSWPTPGSLSD